MTKQITYFIGIALLLAASSASAQSADELRVTVPFPFVTAGKILPAADYRVQINRENGALTLSSPGVSSVMTLTSTDQRAEDGPTCLRFRHLGDRWILKEVSFSGTAQVLPPDKLERDPINIEPSSHEPVVVSIPDAR
jgi:hypothetical protein